MNQPIFDPPQLLLGEKLRRVSALFSMVEGSATSTSRLVLRDSLMILMAHRRRAGYYLRALFDHQTVHR